MKQFLIAAACWVFLASGAISAEAAEPAVEIGEAVKVVNQVNVFSAGSAVQMKVGSTIRTMETVATGDKSSSQFTMRDDTRLAIGPNSQVLLDKFIYDPNPELRQVVLTGLKGAMRFVTGNNPSKTYTIKTPAATIGVRGTMFDVYIDDKGRTVVALLDGRIKVCLPGRPQCRDVNDTGRFLSIDRDGKFAMTTRATKAWLGGVAFGTAFPFLGRRAGLRGKLAVPSRLRTRIRRLAGIGTSPVKTRKRKQLKRKIKTRKKVRRAPPNRHLKSVSRRWDRNDQPPARHRKSVSRRWDYGNPPPPQRHRKSISRRWDYGNPPPPPRHRRSISRRLDGGVIRPPVHRKAISRYRAGGGKIRPRHQKKNSARQRYRWRNPDRLYRNGGGGGNGGGRGGTQ